MAAAFRLEARPLLLMRVLNWASRWCDLFLPAGFDQGGRAVQSEFCRAADDEQFREQLARARDPALYRPDRHLTDRRRFVIGEARRSDQKQRLTLNMRQLRQCLDELLEFQAAELLGGQFQAGQGAAIRILDFAAPLALLRSK